MFVFRLQMRMLLNYLLMSTLQEAKGSHGAMVSSVSESRCLGRANKGRQRGRENGHIHYLHTQAACRSMSRWPGRFALTIPGAHGQPHS